MEPRYRRLLEVLALASLMTALGAGADEEVAPFPYVSVSAGGRIYFKMVPDPAAPFDLERGSGAAYEVRGTEGDVVLWTTSGWYAFTTFLSGDGTHLVRLGNWPRGHAPADSHLAIAFYERDKLLKSYSTKDLILDATRIRPSASHYSFYVGQPGFVEPYGPAFRLVTVDGVEYEFDARSGAIQTTRKKLKAPE